MLNHIAIIPDGNRRWARARIKKPWLGHKIGIDIFHNVINWCLELGVKELTFYTLSVQNFQRDKTELKYLFMYIRNELNKWLHSDEAEKKGIYLNAIGKLTLLPKDIQLQLKQLIKKTKHNKNLKVNFAIGYGGREEIINAVKRIIKNKQKPSIKTLSQNLWLNSEPDLVIRTSDEYRLSNFLIWQTYYSELFFTKKHWPDFDKKELLKAINEYQKRQRRFGK